MQQQEKTGWEPKSKLAGILTFIALIFVGVCVGIVLCRLMAPNSDTANFVSVMMLPISVVAGALVWQGILIVYLSFKLGGLFLKGFKKGGVKAALSQKAEGFPPYPPGTSAFVFVSVSVCLIAGVVVAFTRNAQSFLSVVGLYGFTGLAYGLLQRYLVRAGYFVAFESVAGSPVDDKDTVSQREDQKTIE
jgi:hypothetical protein